MKTNTLYALSLSIFAVVILGAVANSIVNYETVVYTFQALGYPVYLIELLGVAQVVGLAVVILNKDKWLVEWAYAGFFINFALGCIAHLISNNGNGASAVICLIILSITYIQSKKMRSLKKQNVLDMNPEFL